MKDYNSDSTATLERFARDKRKRTVSAERVERRPYPTRDAEERTSEAAERPARRASFNPHFTADNRLREERPHYGDRPAGDRKPYGGPSYGRKFYGDRSTGEGADGKPYGERLQGDKFRKSYGNKPYGRKPYGDRSFETGAPEARPYGERPAESDGFGRKPYGERPYKPYGNRPQGDKPYGRKPYGDRSFDTGASEARPYGDRPAEAGGYGRKPYGGRPQGDKPYATRSYGDKPYGRKPFGERPQGEKPYGERPYGEKPYGRKPFGERSYGPRAGAADRPKSYPRYDPNKQTGEMRLNRFLAQSGLCSRREADDYITAGLVSVNGQIVTELGTKVMPTDEVRFNDERVEGEKKVYLVLNKPKGYVTSLEDPHADKTVMELVKGACTERIYPVGRLDKNSVGLLLFTNDGDLTRQLTHPSLQKKKVYQVTLDKPLTRADMEQIAEGITLEDGEIHADQIAYVREDKREVGLEIHSGRNRIVRRIFEHLGYTVQKLDRVYYAGLTKKNLSRGQWRFLTRDEVMRLKSGQYE